MPLSQGSPPPLTGTLSNVATAKRTVLLVEDEESITEPLAEALSREGFEPVIAGTAAAALELAASRSPDLVLLDLMLPDGSGLDVCRELRSRSSVPIIMVTARGEEMDRVVGLEVGADDYVVKPFSAREVVARIRAVLRRTAAAPPGPPAETIELGDLRVDAARRTATLADEPLELSRKEFDLLRLLVESAGTVVTRERLIDEVWDTNWFGSTKTLDVHVSGLRKKLGDDPNAPRYIHTVRGVGFRFAGADELVSLRLLLLAAFAYVLLLAILALEVPLALNVSRRINAEVKAQAASEAQLVAASASGREGEALDRIVGTAASQLGGRVIVVDEQGRLVSDSAGEGLVGRDYGDRPEIQQALATGRTAQIRRESDTLEQEVLFTAAPVVDEGDLGAVRITQSVDAIDDRVRRDVLGLAAVGLAALAFGLLFAWVLASTLSRPLRGLAAAARRVESGDLEARAEPGGASEQREVAEAFNDMTDRLERVLAAQREFVANASHQLRTPLTGLRLRIEAAGLKADDPALGAELDAAEREAERLARLVTSLLALAREGEQPGPPRPVALADAAGAAVERWEHQAAGATGVSSVRETRTSSPSPARRTWRSCSTT